MYIIDLCLATLGLLFMKQLFRIECWSRLQPILGTTQAVYQHFDVAKNIGRGKLRKSYYTQYPRTAISTSTFKFGSCSSKSKEK